MAMDISNPPKGGSGVSCKTETQVVNLKLETIVSLERIATSLEEIDKTLKALNRWMNERI